MSEPNAAEPETLRPPPEAEPTTTPVTRSDDSAAALSALYQGEKTDASYVFNTAMVMMGVAVAYLVGAIPFVGNFSDRPSGWLFLILLPIPLWLIAAFHSLMTLNALTHGTSVRIIEDELFRASGLHVDRFLVGSAAGDKIMDINRSNAVHKITTVVVYAGVAFLVIGFTAYCLYAADVVVGNQPDMAQGSIVYIAMGLYALLVIMVALSWIVGFGIINKGRAAAQLMQES